MSNAIILLPGSQGMSGAAVTKHPTSPSYGDVYASFADAPFEKGQSAIATDYGWLDVNKATRKNNGWLLFGWFTAK